LWLFTLPACRRAWPASASYFPSGLGGWRLAGDPVAEPYVGRPVLLFECGDAISPLLVWKSILQVPNRSSSGGTDRPRLILHGTTYRGRSPFVLTIWPQTRQPPLPRATPASALVPWRRRLGEKSKFSGGQKRQSCQDMTAASDPRAASSGVAQPAAGSWFCHWAPQPRNPHSSLPRRSPLTMGRSPKGNSRLPGVAGCAKRSATHATALWLRR
jgi:hypothetical protein